MNAAMVGNKRPFKSSMDNIFLFSLKSMLYLSLLLLNLNFVYSTVKLTCVFSLASAFRLFRYEKCHPSKLKIRQMPLNFKICLDTNFKHPNLIKLHENNSNLY